MTSQNKLSAKSFVKNKTYTLQFIKILELCTYAYSLLVANEKNIDGLHEEILRNKLLKYIWQNQGKFGLAKFVFVPESAEIDPKTDKTIGYHDINITIPCNSAFSNEEQKKFILECKRLDGYSTKNKMYIEQGINRFIEEKYVCKLNICGMLGFIEKSSKQFKKNKIEEIVEDLNSKLINDYKRSTSEKLEKKFINTNFFDAYESKHIRDKCKQSIDISHLFFDKTKVLQKLRLKVSA